eukprot:1030869-Rhodomonas_salina.1
MSCIMCLVVGDGELASLYPDVCSALDVLDRKLALLQVSPLASAVYGDDVLSGCDAAVYGGSAHVFGRNNAVYGCDAVVYGGDTAVYEGDAAVYRRNAAVYHRDAAVYGCNADVLRVAAAWRHPASRLP